MMVNNFLPKVKAHLILSHDEDDSLLLSYIAAAVSYAESYQHFPKGFYEGRDGSTGGCFADSVQAGQQVWDTVNLLLRLDRDWKV